MSSITPKFQARQENGRLIVPDAPMFSQYLRSLGDKALELIVRKERKRRSDEQNKMYWKYCEIIGGSFGYYKDEMHRNFKEMFLKEKEFRTIKSTGETVLFEHTGSTADLDTKEFVEYMNRIIQFASEHDIEIPKYEKSVDRTEQADFKEGV